MNINLNISNRIQTKYGLSRYQIAQVKFLLLSLISEISKMIIMGLIFHQYISLYLFFLGIMLCLRCTTGGLHFYTYWSCLAISISYISLTLFLTLNFTLIKPLQLLLLLICLITCYYLGPITSKYRPAETKLHFKRSRNIACHFIFFYALALYIIPDNQYLSGGLWVIILHLLQLSIAKYKQRKETL